MATRIGLISDTHGSVHPKIYEAFEGVSLILHAGDVDSPTVISDLEAIAPVLAVRGNMDRSLSLVALPVFRLIKQGDFQIALIHDLDWLPHELARRGIAEADVDVVVFGHTHVAESWREDQTLFVNPGAAKSRGSEASVAILRIEGRSLSVNHVPLG